jgi:hypothetical protein
MRNQTWLLLIGAVLAVIAVGCADLGGGEVGAPPIEEVGDVGGASDDIPKVGKQSPGALTANPLGLPESADLEQVLYVPEGGKLSVALDGDATELLGQGFTLDLWLKVSDEGNQVILSAGDLKLEVEYGVLQAAVADQRLSGQPIFRDDWYHVALVVDGNEARFYINGTVQDREFLKGDWSRPSGNLVLGHRPSHPRSFIGHVENLRLAAEVVYTQAYFYPSTKISQVDFTLFSYTFDQVDGMKVIDASSNSLHARLAGGANPTKGSI